MPRGFTSNKMKIKIPLLLEIVYYALISGFPGRRPRGHPRGIKISYNQNFEKTRA